MNEEEDEVYTFSDEDILLLETEKLQIEQRSTQDDVDILVVEPAGGVGGDKE
jgi:hypothetical protein